MKNEASEKKGHVKVSVLMSIFNAKIEFIKRAIDSVLSQDFQDFELIIIDDGSKAEIRTQLLEYVENAQHEIIYIRHTNRGQSL